MPAFCDLKGLVFSRWLVIAKSNIAGRTQWECKCECGVVRPVLSSSLISGKSKSCGCLNKEKASERLTLRMKTHGLSRTAAYASWSSMVKRCTNKKNNEWENYGGRGIGICDRWKNSFENFLEDMGNPPPGMSIDRINNDLGYSKENCRWATRTEQNRNKRSCRQISFNGETKGFGEWAEHYCIDRRKLYSRVINCGWSFDKAVSTALQEKIADVRTRK